MRRRRSEDQWKAAPGRLGRLARVQAASLAVLGTVAVAIAFVLTQGVRDAQDARQHAEEVRSSLIVLRDNLRVQHVNYWKRREGGDLGVPRAVALGVRLAVPRVAALRAQSAAGGSAEALTAADRTRRLLAEVARGIAEIQAASDPASEATASARNEGMIDRLAAAASEWVDAESARAAAAGDRQERLAARLTRTGTGVIAALVAAALVAWLLFERARRQVVTDLKGAADHLEDLAVTDALTGLANRRGFDQALAVERARARRTGRPLALVLFDIDHFKEVNDRLGHAAGDRVLVEVARRLEGIARGHELVARIGGEEFAWLLPDADIDAAIVVAERARAVVATAPVEDLEITVSAGVSDLIVGGEHLVESADAALYAAKGAGRNRAIRA